MPQIPMFEDRPKKVFKEIDVELPDLDKKPYFAFPLRDRFIQEGDNFKLTCTVEGYPQPEVSWGVIAETAENFRRSKPWDYLLFPFYKW